MCVCGVFISVYMCVCMCVCVQLRGRWVEIHMCERVFIVLCVLCVFSMLVFFSVDDNKLTFFTPACLLG